MKKQQPYTVADIRDLLNGLPAAAAALIADDIVRNREDYADAEYKRGEADGIEKVATMLHPRGHAYARGITDVRRMYAQAWVDGTGEPMSEVAFTTTFVRDQARALVNLRNIVDECLGKLGPEGYVPVFGEPLTRRLQAALDESK